MVKFGGVSEKCILCTKSVYQAERIATTTGNVYHKNCFRCTTCNKQLVPTTASEDSKTLRIYCKTHFTAVQSAAPDPNVKALEGKAKKVELEEAAEDLHEGSAVWLELTDAVLKATPGLKPPEGSEECFCRASVVALDSADPKNPKATVTTADGLTVTAPRKCVLKCDAGMVQSNNLLLVELNEPSLLHNLRARFDKQQPYTYTGELELMCLNPYEQLPCYDASVMEQCKEGTYKEPHTWAVAERIFKAMSCASTVAQSVVVSGESGAGKTERPPAEEGETNKHVMAYLRWRAHDSGKAGHAERISSIIGESNVLLEARRRPPLPLPMLRALQPSARRPPQRARAPRAAPRTTAAQALGNAKTTNNKNSSRFGKYLELAFSTSGNYAICGARFKTFLLEKSRVAHQAPWPNRDAPPCPRGGEPPPPPHHHSPTLPLDLPQPRMVAATRLPAHRQAPSERNFHAFYLLLSAPDTALLRALQLRGAGEHVYTRTTPQAADEHARAREHFGEFDAVVRSELVTATAGQEGRDALYGVLAAVLHLGDISFDASKEEKATPDAAGKVALDAAAKALQYSPDELLLNLSQRWIAAGPNEEICVPLPPSEGRQVRDAVGKAIYQRLFLYYVTMLNNALSPGALGASVAAKPAAPARRVSLTSALSNVGATEKVVGLLDVFGFESLSQNGLEQICINLANERLHALFLGNVFQGLPPSQLKTLLGGDAGRIDNSACLDMLAKAPQGILHLLDFQCKAPKASDSAFCLAVNQTHGASQFLRTPKISKATGVTADEKSGFFVRHFAGDVLYTAGNFLELNNDSMNSKRWLESGVGNKLVQHLFTATELQPAAPAKKGFISVGQKFSTDLNELITTLRATDMSFIRCMKSNTLMKPRLFQPAVVRQKVRAAGTLSALKFVRKLMPGKLKVATLMRLAAKPHIDTLPAELRGLSEPQKFAAELLRVLGVPTDQVRFEAGDVHVTTALVPFLAQMEEKGEGEDAQAAAAAATMAADVKERSEAQRRTKEKEAQAVHVERVKKEVAKQSIGEGLRKMRVSRSARCVFGEDSIKSEASLPPSAQLPAPGAKPPATASKGAAVAKAPAAAGPSAGVESGGLLPGDLEDAQKGYEEHRTSMAPRKHMSLAAPKEKPGRRVEGKGSSGDANLSFVRQAAEAHALKNAAAVGASPMGQRACVLNTGAVASASAPGLNQLDAIKESPRGNTPRSARSTADFSARERAGSIESSESTTPRSIKDRAASLESSGGTTPRSFRESPRSDRSDLPPTPVVGSSGRSSLQKDKDELLEKNALLEREIIRLKTDLAAAQKGLGNGGIGCCEVCGVSALPKFCGHCAGPIRGWEAVNGTAAEDPNKPVKQRRRRTIQSPGHLTDAAPAAVDRVAC